MVYMVISIATVVRLDREAPEACIELVTIDWASNDITFAEKVGSSEKGKEGADSPEPAS